MSLALTQLQAPPGRISLAGITADRLAALTPEAAARLPLTWGRQRLALGDFFRVHSHGGEELVIEGADTRFCALGAGMRAGVCRIEGPAGDFVGQDMEGGSLLVRGSVGRFAASGMAGGSLQIEGDAGAGLGAALPWAAAGMRGGRVVLNGSAGERCGDRMRRGEIFIAQDAGALCATRMIAGSIVVGGRLGSHAGTAMRRGSVLLLAAAFAPPATFVETAMCADAYLGLLWRDWAARFASGSPFGDFARAALARGVHPRRWMGDLASDGRGEIFGLAGG